MAARLPIWVTLSLRESATIAEWCQRANALCVRAEEASEGRIQLPGGFLAWLESGTLDRRRLDGGVAKEPFEARPVQPARERRHQRAGGDDPPVGPRDAAAD
ncbi:MAG: hypothetical protein QM765_31725 [Myxococcales bacterium]